MLQSLSFKTRYILVYTINKVIKQQVNSDNFLHNPKIHFHTPNESTIITIDFISTRLIHKLESTICANKKISDQEAQKRVYQSKIALFA